MIRVVLAVALATALLGASLPAAERVERDRNAALATTELESVAAEIQRLVDENDPVPSDEIPARTIVILRPPVPSLTDGGRFVVADDRLVWDPVTGRNHTVRPPVPLRVGSSLHAARRTRIRLTFVRVDGEGVVRVERQRVYNRRRGQTSRARSPPVTRAGVSL